MQKINLERRTSLGFCVVLVLISMGLLGSFVSCGGKKSAATGGTTAGTTTGATKGKISLQLKLSK